MKQIELFLNKLYSYDPHGEISTGDIFDKLPTMGLLKEEFTQGIIITPSCDLANDKTDTITYLPIVPIHSYFCSGKGYNIIKSEIINLSNSLNKDSSLFRNRQIPCSEEIELFLTQFVDGQVLKGKDAERKEKLDSCLQLISNIRDEKQNRLDGSKLNNIWNSQFDKLLFGLIKNSSSSDVHFLPREKLKKEDCIVISEHSLVLFRYPITVHSEVIKKAKDTDQENIASWVSFIQTLKAVPCVKSFTEIPLRGLRLQQDFLSDLLTRYISLYIRIGSPDFYDFHIDEIQQEFINDLK